MEILELEKERLIEESNIVKFSIQNVHNRLGEERTTGYSKALELEFLIKNKLRYQGFLTQNLDATNRYYGEVFENLLQTEEIQRMMIEDMRDKLLIYQAEKQNLMQKMDSNYSAYKKLKMLNRIKEEQDEKIKSYGDLVIKILDYLKESGNSDFTVSYGEMIKKLSNTCKENQEADAIYHKQANEDPRKIIPYNRSSQSQSHKNRASSPLISKNRPANLIL